MLERKPKVMKLSEYDKIVVAYKTYISNLSVTVTLCQTIFVTSPL